MKKIIKFAVILIVSVSLCANLYFFGGKFWQNQKSQLITSGALQMREAIFQAVDKGETRLSNAKGDKTITITKTIKSVVEQNTKTIEEINK